MRRQPTWFLILVAGLTVAADQAAKAVVAANLPPNHLWMPIEWLAPYLSLTHTHNTGAAFGMFPAGGQVFTVISIVVSVAIVLYFHNLPPGRWWVRAGLSLQLGGAIGNLIDRFRLGYVVDFIDLHRFPVFNLADSAIVVGVSILAVTMLLEERQALRARQGDGQQPDPDAHEGPAWP
jgi:signal peptidase II